MKKYFLSILVILGFAVYTLHFRFGGLNNVYIANNTNQQNSQSPYDETAAVSVDSPSTSVPRVPVVSKKIGYKDGTYIGSNSDAYFGNVQVEAVIQNGKITDVQFLTYPTDRSTSKRINDKAAPVLKTEAVQAQSSNVDIVSGATQTSQAFMESLAFALKQATI